MTTKVKKNREYALNLHFNVSFSHLKEDERSCPERWKQQKWGAKTILIMKRNTNYYRKMLFKF